MQCHHGGALAHKITKSSKTRQCFMVSEGESIDCGLLFRRIILILYFRAPYYGN